MAKLQSPCPHGTKRRILPGSGGGTQIGYNSIPQQTRFTVGQFHPLIWLPADLYDFQAMEMISLCLNGETRSVPASCNVHDLLRILEIGEERIAVEVNRTILRRADWDSVTLDDGDRVEIVQFVGGG